MAVWKNTGILLKRQSIFRKLQHLIYRNRFPRAGTPNAKSDLKMVTFQVNEKGEFIDIQLLELPQPLGIMFPSAEYLTRAGWTPEGDQ